MMMDHMIYAAVSLHCITHGQLRHVQGEPWLVYLPCFVPEGPSSGQCLMQMSLSKGSGKKFKASSPFGIQYTFHLEDAVDCPEWIVPFYLFKSLAEEYDLELVFVKNSHEFVEEYLKKPEFSELMRRLGALGDGKQDQSTLSQDEWDVAYLYLSFVLRKRGQPNSYQKKSNTNKGKMFISEDDIEFIANV